MTQPIELLVSVSSAAEARIALQGGADIIDVKDPNNGALGFAEGRVLADVNSVINSHRLTTGNNIRFSAALGELSEWKAGGACNESLGSGELNYAKIGLAGEVQADAEQNSWVENWLAVRNHLNNVNEWVAVVYSDYRRCGAPGPQVVIEEASKSGCPIVLFDTAIKDGRTTFDHLSLSELQGLIQQCHDDGMQVALAGQIGVREMEQLRILQPDIVAVRGAVCKNGDRRLQIEASRVEALKKMIQELPARTV